MKQSGDRVKETPDEQILELLGAQASFNKGFGMLMARYQERLYWHIRRMVTEHSDADDVLQNTFIKVFKGIGKFKAESKLYTWLYRIATNEAITFINQRKRKGTTSIDDEEFGVSEKLTADVFFDGDALEAKLRAAILMLPEKQQVVFNMRYYDDMTYKEISEVLGTSVGGLKASYHHAAKKIEAHFKEAEV